jgi:hypothetical protein
VKQTGVPVGALIGGLLIPFLLGLVFYSATLGTTIRLGPFGTALVTAMLILMVALSLQPIRTYFDQDKDPNQKISFGDLRTTLAMVFANPYLRDIAFSAFAFGGLQSLFAGFFILYLIDGLGYSEIEAGTAFAISSFTAIWARIVWGVLGGGFIPSRWIFSGIGFFGAIAALLMTQFDFSWSLNEIIMVAILFNITGLSWHGILLAETARLAPEGQVGGVTGGVLSFTSLAMMTYPAIYGLILAATGSYQIGFALSAIPAFAACLIFLNPPYAGSWTSFCLRLGRSLISIRALAHVVVLIALSGAFGLIFQAFGYR